MDDSPSYLLINIKKKHRKTAMKLLPCNTLSRMHDLYCGHRVQQVDLRAACGSNCSRSSPGNQAFTGAERRFRQDSDSIICPVCAFKTIASEKGINVLSVHHASVSVELDGLPRLRLMSAAEVRYNSCTEMMTAQGYRRAEPVLELDYLAELVRQNPQIVVGANDGPDLQVIMNGLVVSIEDQTDDMADDFEEGGMDLVWIEEKE
ncbi:hypothetical protein E8E12_004355 [Didymella heteroderae]|uniref:Uncharacterized protein n=1 Tax=Didymella heteroderae TaxID=1769908 RepID=A0A9P4WJS0_9PLEO|nr:hypothetical protein E8E12_004355 [Didymella heteroderae]